MMKMLKGLKEIIFTFIENKFIISRDENLKRVRENP